MRNKNGNVADDLYASIIAITLEVEPLSEEKKLIKLLRFDLVAELILRRSYRIAFSSRQ